MAENHKWKIELNKRSFIENEENLQKYETEFVDSVPQNEKKEEFGGAKRKNFNELWRWDTLEDVDFK